MTPFKITSWNLLSLVRGMHTGLWAPRKSKSPIRFLFLMQTLISRELASRIKVHKKLFIESIYQLSRYVAYQFAIQLVKRNVLLGILYSYFFYRFVVRNGATYSVALSLINKIQQLLMFDV